MEEAVIVSGARTPVGKGGKGALAHLRSDSMAAACLKESLRRAPGIAASEVEDVILGCAMPEAEQGMNVARLSSLLAGIPDTASAMTVNRYCASGLQSIAMASDRITLGQAGTILAGGLESMSLIPMGGHKIAPNPDLVEKRPEAYMTMGLTAEKVAEKYGIGREEQDRYALQSHERALQALAEGRFSDETLPLRWKENGLDERGKRVERDLLLEKDEGPRADTSIEALASLKPVFKTGGTVTAGNSSQVSDGAAAVLVTTRKKAEAAGLKPLGRLLGYQVVGVPPEIMGIGPAYAIPALLKKAGLRKEDIDLFEINEAFASQTLAVLRELGLDPAKVNVNGGAIALGHPLGCTGTKLTLSLLHEMKRRKSRYGIVSMCVGGGMGAAGLFEVDP